MNATAAAPVMTGRVLQATATHPVTIYYCKAGIQTGRTVRVVQSVQVYETASISIQWATGAMTHDNSKGKPKASGARCVLILTNGTIAFEGVLI